MDGSPYPCHKVIQKLCVLLGIVVAVAGCRAEDELTYFLDFSTDDTQEDSIAASFDEWQSVTGIAAREVPDVQRAVIVFRVGALPGNAVGLTTYSTDANFEAESLSNIEVLERAEVISEPELWSRDADGRLRHFNHEIGHVLTGGGHTEECPSTMHPNSDTCGTEFIDPEAASRARARIADGWLSRAEQIIVPASIRP